MTHIVLKLMAVNVFVRMHITSLLAKYHSVTKQQVIYLLAIPQNASTFAFGEILNKCSIEEQRIAYLSG